MGMSKIGILVGCWVWAAKCKCSSNNTAQCTVQLLKRSYCLFQLGAKLMAATAALPTYLRGEQGDTKE